jgi:phenylacetic acid degradation operon negative regulatory protein
MKPASIILDLLRTYSSRGTAVQKIMATGSMFGFSENLMRVSLSRLATKGTIENFKRGFYRLTDSTDHLNDFIEEWRLGEARRRDWNGHWILVEHEGDSWALKANGFTKIDGNIWVRPDNLARSTEQLQVLLENLGAKPDCIVATGANLIGKRVNNALAHINLEALNQSYTQATVKLADSLNRLNTMPVDAAQRESFHLGGNAIQILALDPLLPDEVMTAIDRHELWKITLTYDKVGREIWRDRTGEQLTTLPRAQVNTR